MKWRLFIFFCLSCGSALASVQVRISEPNSLQEMNLTEIMVGTNVSLLVHSDANDFWSGSFFIEGQDRGIGILQARGDDPNSRDHSGSHLEAAGELAHVWKWNDSNIWGFDLYCDDFERTSGDWFVIDYQALGEGECTVGFYDHTYSWTVPDPNISFTFLNTPTRDLLPDGFVNLSDFAVFSSYWEAEGCSDPNSGCYQADFSRDGAVGLEDVVMFADFWLWGNPGWKPAETISGDPNTPDPNTVYDITYAIVDANSLSEITLEVGQSITLYIVKSSSSETVNIFDMDVTISDPNWGSIDNSETGTAEILAAPRMEAFDYIGPAEIQAEGIGFLAANIGSTILDGDMTSFVYTAIDPNDVTLSLTNYSSTGANLESITIHQILPAVEMLQQAYLESPELQESVPEAEWNAFIDSVEQTK
ncbi:MAG: hypothetical protein H8D56_04450 [Planctomycetes bacterium]|nr:hypothetical protein [Planctomycetota bacterium]